MFVFKQSTSNRILVGISDSTTGLGVTGLAFNASGLSFKLAKSGGAEATKTLSAPDWVEAGHGWYWVTLSAGDCDTLGIGILIPIYSGVEGSYPFEVRANIESDVFTRVGAPAGASLAADVATVAGYIDTEVAAIKAKTDNLPSDPADASDIATATSAISTAVAAVSTKLGTPAGASISADIAAVATGVASASSALAVIRGLSGADSYEDSFQYSGPSGALSDSRLRTYDSAANAAAHGVTGLLKTYTFSFGYTGSNLTSVQITET